MCSPYSSSSDSKRQKVAKTAAVGDDVPAGAAETAGTDPLTAAAEAVTIAVAGTTPGHLAPLASVTPPPAMGTVVAKPRALRLKKSAVKSTL